MSKEGYSMYQEELTKEKISQIWKENATFQEKYTRWSEKVKQIEDKFKVTKRRKKCISKEQRLMQRLHKQLKASKKKCTQEDRVKIDEEIKDLKEKILNAEQEQKMRKIQKVVESISKNGKIQGGAFWEFRSRMIKSMKNEDTVHAMLNEKGEKVESEEEIRKVYEDFYKKLLNNQEEQEKIECSAEVLKDFEEIMERGSKQSPLKVDLEIIDEVIRNLKKGKSRDKQDWNNEMIIEGGPEMKESIVEMTNYILEKEIMPEEWEEMMIKSLHKKGIKTLMKNKRGLFLTNILSKVLEKTIEKLSRKLMYDIGQSGGTKGRSTVDNWLILMAIRDMNRYLNRNTYLFFGDLVKCFDKLWLKDCLVDLHKAGMREREIRLLYMLNKRAKATVITPAGETNKIDIVEAAKQGTVFGPKLCCASTGQINHIGEKTNTVIYPAITVEALTYVDDLLGIGSIKIIEKIIENCSKMEKRKGMEWSLEKSNWMGMKTGREKIQEVNAMVKSGKIKQCEVYKLLGNWLNSAGNMDKQLEEMEKKVPAYKRDCNNIAAQSRIGKMELEAKLVIYEKVVKTSLFYNLEAWSNIREKDYNKMEMIQGDLLKGILGLPRSTPYYGVLYETKIIPARLEIWYRKLMLYHGIINSDEDRIVKKILIEQERSQQVKCWFSELKEIGDKIGMEVRGDKAKEKRKSEWKKEAKEKVRKEADRMETEKIKNMKKLRFLKAGRAVETYWKELYNDDARLAMKIRLNMIETIGSNFGMRTECLLCGSLDSTEHVLSCEKMERRSSRAGIEELGKGERMGEIVKQFQEMERERTIEMKTKTEREINDMCDVSVNMNGYAAANGLDVENEPGDEMIL